MIDISFINKDIKLYMVLCESVTDGQYYPAIGANGLPLLSFNASTLGKIVESRKEAEKYVPNIVVEKNWRGKMVKVDRGEYVKQYSNVVIVEYNANPTMIIK